jgi:hypothetical protein
VIFGRKRRKGGGFVPFCSINSLEYGLIGLKTRFAAGLAIWLAGTRATSEWITGVWASGPLDSMAELCPKVKG